MDRRKPDYRIPLLLIWFYGLVLRGLYGWKIKYIRAKISSGIEIFEDLIINLKLVLLMKILIVLKLSINLNTDLLLYWSLFICLVSQSFTYNISLIEIQKSFLLIIYKLLLPIDSIPRFHIRVLNI